MTFDDAVELAREIRARRKRTVVLAVGRFKPPAELDREPERWGVSVVIDDGRLIVIWEPAELDRYPEPSPPPRTIESTGVPLLF